MVFCGNASKQQNKAYKKFTRRFLTVTYYIFLYTIATYVAQIFWITASYLSKNLFHTRLNFYLGRIVQILNVIAKALPTGRIARIVQIDLSRVSSFLAVKVY